ncbi:hypothetical protein Acr_14g0001780 [Actinidia rufa]|uniref:Uncharacterized protein n=1 Tax=Actinidia rufa TaxID=165716 RepID=A0A7J0FP96_9ERIC|nr:hypothetical protein Acr_14g0001780 [Actinidia rufa]
MSPCWSALECVSLPLTLDPQRLSDKSPTDWHKAWSSFKKQGKKSIFSQFSPNKYVSWNPRRSQYPLSEEVDPIKRTERSNLMLWTSPSFTLGGAIACAVKNFVFFTKEAVEDEYCKLYVIATTSMNTIIPLHKKLIGLTFSSLAMAVLNESVKPRKARKVRLPPKRGQVKVQIFQSFVKVVTDVISKAVALGRKKERGKESDSRGRSAFTTTRQSDI